MYIHQKEYPMKANLHNNEISTIVELIIAKYNELLNESTIDQLVDQLHDTEHELGNKEEHQYILQSLQSDRDIYAKLVTYTVKHIVMSGVKELPLLVLLNMVAEQLSGRKTTSRMRIAATIVKLLEKCDSFFITKKLNKDNHLERIVGLRYVLSTLSKEELLAKQYNQTLSFEPVEGKRKVAGHRKKVSRDNNHMLPLLDKLNTVGYTLDERVWNKYKYELSAYRFDDIATQTTMRTEGDKLLGKTFYFSHIFGPDNGRIYCEGDLFTLHGGALNYVYKFANKRMLTARGLEILEAKVAELEAELSTLSFKEKVEYYSLSLDLIDAHHGKPVGTILHRDAKLSGLQHQCIATRCKSEALYCGLLSTLRDGYSHIRELLSNAHELSRDMVKKAYNPYQYGAGAKATIEPVQLLGGRLDFKEWESAYSKAFPNAFRLRSFLLTVAKEYTNDIFTYTSPSGYNCAITALGTETDYVNTCYGKVKYERKEVDAKHMGVKLVAAFSHMLDAATLHHVVAGADFDLHVVHDSFGAHPNDLDTVETLYVHAQQKHLTMPILRDFIAEVIGKEQADVNVSRLMANTLTPSDIVAGLY